ncbi:MAG: class I SAM-dependent methyltransferase [Trueperaceae bacterium]|nr:class I SAM-dependent methyltransferase [Trueperaceae bacterium]
MSVDYLIHDELYKESRAKGWSGWGGNERMAREHILPERLFSFRDVPRAGSSLELGCGEGHYSRILAKKGYQVTGVDVSQTAIDWAKEKTRETAYEIDFLVCDLSKPQVLLNQSFDLVVDGNCLHCIIGKDREIFLNNVHRVLKESGIFFISSLCSSSGVDEIIERNGQPYRTVLSYESLLAELETSGFEVKKSIFYQGDKTSHCTAHVSKCAY